MARKKFRTRYVSGVQAITPDQTRINRVRQSNEDIGAVTGAVATAALTPILGPLAGPAGAIIGKGGELVAKVLTKGKRRAIAKQEEGIAAQATGNLQIEQDSTAVQENVKSGKRFDVGVNQITSAKAGKILVDGSIGGKNLTKKQVGFFRFVKGGGTPTKTVKKGTKAIVDPDNIVLTDKGVLFELDNGGQIEENQTVEAEKDEMLFRKINGRWKLILDLNQGKRHEEGGEDVAVQEGDVIFPGTKREKLISLLDTNGFVGRDKEPEFETERFKLPTDEKVEEGEELQTGAEISGFQKFIGGEGGDAITAGLGALGPLSNLLAGKPEVETRRFVTPKKVGFVDVAEARKGEARRQEQVDIENITGLAGGNAGVALSNIGAASNRTRENLDRINVESAQARQQVQNINVGIENRADERNVDLAIGFDEKDAQNRAQQRNIRREGFTQIGELAQDQQTRRDLKVRDEKQDIFNNAFLSFITGGQGFLDTPKLSTLDPNSQGGQDTQLEAEGFISDSTGSPVGRRKGFRGGTKFIRNTGSEISVSHLFGNFI